MLGPRRARYNFPMLASSTTHVSLLARLSDRTDMAAWREFSDRYGELIRTVGRRRGLQAADCDDLVQDVLVSLCKAIESFEYAPEKGRFRAYLKTITLHAITRILRQRSATAALGTLEPLVDPGSGDAAHDGVWEEEWRAHHVRRAMQIIAVEFAAPELRAFQRYAVDGADAQSVAEALNLSVNQVYKAKSRILKRLAGLVREQVDDEG